MSDNEQHTSLTLPDKSVPRLFETSAGLTARLGRLTLPNRRPIETPTYLAVTSRGSIPHLTPDNLEKYSSVEAVYAGLEDFVERRDSPVFHAPNKARRRLHSFAAIPGDVLTILGPRRCPAVTTPVGNTAKTISVFTSTGFRNVTVREYASAAAAVQPDIVIPMADLPHTSKTPVAKKLIRIVEHTELWLDEFLSATSPTTTSPSGEEEEEEERGAASIFAPVLPVELPIQWDYLRHLSEDVVDDISGLAVYDANLLPDLAGYAPLAALPKLSMDGPRSPHDVLRQIALGIDVCILPFVNNASDAGVAFTFTFPGPEECEGDRDDDDGRGGAGVRPLGIDMWAPELSTAVAPLAQDCACYACTKHHRAYVQHLLNAKEMLGWNLLQIHNHHVMDGFFRAVRGSLGEGGVEGFERDRMRFAASYEPALPQGTGERPRARGYHFKSEAASERINKPSWADLHKDGVVPTANGHAELVRLDE